jgi:hypothetical protein
MTPPLIGIRRSLVGRRVSPENRLNLRGTTLQVGETVRFSSIGLNAGAPAAEMAQGRLRRYHAGRELRVRRSELSQLMQRPELPGDTRNEADATPEKEAELYLQRRRQGVPPRRFG